MEIAATFNRAPLLRLEIEAAKTIASVLRKVEPTSRTNVLTEAVQLLRAADARSANQHYVPLPQDGVCAFCDRPFERKSTNQRYCRYRCQRAGAKKRRIELGMERVLKSA